MNKALRFSFGSGLVALPLLILVPGCSGGSGLFPQPTATPTSTATSTPTGTTQTSTPTGTAPTATPTNTTLPTPTPTNTPRPTATPTTGPNVDLTLARVSGTPNTPLTPIKSDFLGIYYFSGGNSYLQTTPTQNPFKRITLATIGDVHSYRVGQSLTLAPANIVTRGAFYFYEPPSPANTTYTWSNKSQTGNGTILVVDKSATSITLLLTNLVMVPAFPGEPATGEFSFSGKIRCNLTAAPA